MDKIADENGELLTARTVYVREHEKVLVIDGRQQGRSANFTKLKNSQKAKRRLRKLSTTEAGFLLKIIPYLSPGSNMLIGDGEIGDRGVPLRVTELYEIAGLHHTTGKNVFNSLVKKNLIGYVVTEGIKKAILVNPDYALNGKQPNPELVEAFRSLLAIDKE